MKNLLTFLLVALLAFSVGWAETTTVTASRITSSSVTWTGSGNETWNVIVNEGATNQNVNNSYAQISLRFQGLASKYPNELSNHSNIIIDALQSINQVKREYMAIQQNAQGTNP